MKKVLFIVAYEGFNDRELLVTRERLMNKGYDVEVASTSLGFATGMSGTTVKPDLDLEEAAINLNRYSAIVFIGGNGAKRHFGSALCHEIAKDASKAGKVVAAISVAPVILAKAGILDGVDATVFTRAFDRRYADELKFNGARYHAKEVIADRNIVTADSPEAAEKFANKISELMEG